MDRERKNQLRRERDAALSDSKKAEMLQRRRERYREKTAQVSPSMDADPVGQFSSPSGNASAGIDVTDIRAPVAFAGKRKGVGLGSSSRANDARRNRSSRLIDAVPLEQWSLPPISTCIYCGALRFYCESPTFCCGEGQVSLAPRVMVPELAALLTGDSDDSVQFRKNIRSYNNDISFTTIGAVFHNLSSINEGSSSGANLDLYFHEVGNGPVGSAGRGSYLKADLVCRLIKLLECNPYCRFFKNLRQLVPLAKYTIVLRSTPDLDQNTFNLPTVSQVGAIWTESDTPAEGISRDIRVYVNEDTSHPIQYYYACYDPLQYPLLFPRGEPGWHAKVKKYARRTKHLGVHASSSSLTEADVLISPSLAPSAAALMSNEASVYEDGQREGFDVSMRQYYCYLFQMRRMDMSYLLHFGRLTQQFSIDMYIKIETQRLDYYRSEQRQQEFRLETFQGVVDSMSVDGENNASAIGRRYLLPASFIGGHRDLHQRYVNAMALVQKFGKPDIFITMTCNPNWREIQELLRFHERSDDRPDLVARVFKAKLEEFKNDVIKKELFGPVAAYVYTVEFQKRGLPHVHWILILKASHKITSPEMYDRMISAELPEVGSHPFLRTYVIKHMLHGPCGPANPSNACMRDGSCKNHYPKNYNSSSTVGANSYPLYRRRDNGDFVLVRKSNLDNRWVVPYNPYLLAKFDCHINVEACCDIKVVKYLYKYIYKGHDRIAYVLVDEGARQNYDEISNFQTGRWVAAPEAFWRIFGFPLYEMYPPVIVLPIHLENHQVIRFGRVEPLMNVVNDPASQRTKLTEFFKKNACDPKAKALNLLYKEFPEYYVWNTYLKTWVERAKKQVIGRLVAVNPSEGERFYERLLLSNVRGPPSMAALRTVHGIEYPTFRQAALELGLLDSDSYVDQCLEEASLHGMPVSLRRLFATILVYCSPASPISLWNTFKDHLSHDFALAGGSSSFDSVSPEQRALQSIHYTLQSMGKSIGEYGLTESMVRMTEEEKFGLELQRERSIVVSEDDLFSEKLLNGCQRNIFESVISSLNSNISCSFFVDGPGGSGKTFLYRSILAYVRSRGDIALAVATSGVAASLLPGGRTAHSRFKFPLDVDDVSGARLSKQSSLSRLIKVAKLIVWDEATMANKNIIESLDALLRDICENDTPFGGKVVLFGGDFRQTLPIIVGGSRDDMVGASFVSSRLWGSLKKFRLQFNMRAQGDSSFTEFLMGVGNGTCSFVKKDVIELPAHMCIPFTTEAESLDSLIRFVFPCFEYERTDVFSLVGKAILTPTNDIVDSINLNLIGKFPGTPVEYVSYDITDDVAHQGEYVDYMNSVSIGGLPPHKLVLKPNCPIILLRNLDPSEGLCNGTRLIVRHLGPRVIGAEIATGDYKGKHVFIPRIPLQASDKSKCLISFKRHQFPVQLCFAMTINKAQGQTLSSVGIYLREPVFSHGQLYVALSRVRSFANVKVLIVPPPATDPMVAVTCTNNIVYDEIFALASRGQ